MRRTLVGGHVDLDRRVAAAVIDGTRVHSSDLGHGGGAGERSALAARHGSPPQGPDPSREERKRGRERRRREHTMHEGKVCPRGRNVEKRGLMMAGYGAPKGRGQGAEDQFAFCALFSFCFCCAFARCGGGVGGPAVRTGRRAGKASEGRRCVLRVLSVSACATVGIWPCGRPVRQSCCCSRGPFAPRICAGPQIEQDDATAGRLHFGGRVRH